MAFSDARTQVPQPQVRVSQDQAPVDQTLGNTINAFGQIGGQFRLGQVEGGLSRDLGVSGNIISTLNDPNTVEIVDEDLGPSGLFDLSISDPTGTVDQTSDEFKRIAVGLDQGKISDERAAIEAEVVLRKSIARAPGFSTQLRQLAFDVLGFNASGAALEALFLSGPSTSGKLTLAQKDDAAADQLVKVGQAATHEQGLQIVVGARASAAKKANQQHQMQLAQLNAPRVAVAAGEQAQFLMNDAMLQGIGQIRSDGFVTDLENLTNGLRAARETAISEVTGAMANNPNNFYDTAAYDGVREEINRVFEANVGLLENQDVLKVLTKRQDLLQTVLGIEAFNIAPELMLMATFGPQAVEDYLELMASSKGNPQAMEKFMKVNPAFRFVGEAALEARAIGPTLRAIANGNLGALVNNGEIDEETARGVGKFNALKHIEGLGNPENFDNDITALNDLDLPEMVMSTAAQTRNSWNLTSPENRQAISQQFVTGQQTQMSSLSNMLTNTPFLMGWDPRTQQFAIERRDEDLTALTDTELTARFDASGGPPSISQLEAIQATPRAPGDFAGDQVRVLNEVLLPLMRDARWRNTINRSDQEADTLDPNVWANNLISDINALTIDNELLNAGDLGAKGTVQRLTVGQQVRLRNAMQTGDQEEVFRFLKEELNAGDFNQRVEASLGTPLERVNEGDIFIDTNTGNLVQIGPEGEVVSKVAGSGVLPGRDTGQLTGERPVISQSANPKTVQLAREAAKDIGIPEEVFLALVQQESRFDPNAVSPRGAQGLTQLMPGTAKELGVTDPFDPEENLTGGATFLKQMLERFGTIDKALAAYNGGPNRLARVDEDISKMPAETQAYVKTILENAGIEGSE